MNITAKTHFKIIGFTQLVNWSAYALLGENLIYTQKYPFVRIGNFLQRNREQVLIEDSVLYKRPTIKINGNGIRLRDEVYGKIIGTKNQFRINENQFLLSKIDARNGAFGVVPQELDNSIITGNFWTFDVDYSSINPHYLTLLTKTKQFQKLCQTASVGTTNRNYLQEKLFLNFEIPLPTLKDQKILLSNYNSKTKQANLLGQQATNAEREMREYFLSMLGVDESADLALKKGLNLIKYINLSKWSLSHINKRMYDLESGKFKTELLKNLLVFFEGGKTPSKSRSDFWNGDIYWTSPKDFNGRIIIEKAEDKITRAAVKEAGMKIYPKGTILSVFRSGILQHSFPTAITNIKTAINQDLKAYSLREDLIDKRYYLYFVHTFRKYILSLASKKSVTVESINTEDFFEIPIPLPPMDIQQEISTKITFLMDKVHNLRSQKINLEHEAEHEFEAAIFNS